MKLSPIEKQALAALTYHEGFKVLVRLMERRVQNATARMLDVAPDDSDRATKISLLQSDAFARNAFCAELLEEVNWHNASIAAEDAEEAEEATVLTKVGYVQNNGEKQ